jgi:hypothetical protein
VPLAKHLNVPTDDVRELCEIRALCLLGAQRGKEALTLANEMITDYEKNLLPDDPAKIFILTLHAEALRSAGQPKKAMAAFESLFKRLDIRPTEPNPTDVISVQLSYPIALRQAGEPERALVEARKNIHQSKQLLGLVDLHTARSPPHRNQRPGVPDAQSHARPPAESSRTKDQPYHQPDARASGAYLGHAKTAFQQSPPFPEVA